MSLSEKNLKSAPMKKLTGILQPGISVDHNGTVCGNCRFCTGKFYLGRTDIHCQLFDKLIKSFCVGTKLENITRIDECIGCEVLWDEKTGYTERYNGKTNYK